MFERTALALLVVITFFAAPVYAQEGAISFKNEFPDPSLTGPPISFVSKLSADEESAVVESTGVGEVSFTLERPTQRLSWRLRYSGLSSPATSISIHGPGTPGVNAGVLFDLAPKGVPKGTAGETQGFVKLTEGELSYLLMDRMYVNIVTEKHTDGEIRGEIDRIRSNPLTAKR